MKRDAATGLVEGWRRWLLALTLCVFAVAYGAPTSLAAHPPMSHAAMDSGCPEAVGPLAKGAAKPHADTSSACCIAHCLPAAPAFVSAQFDEPVTIGERQVRLDESGEGQSVPVPLPPPRSSARA